MVVRTSAHPPRTSAGPRHAARHRCDPAPSVALHRARPIAFVAAVGLLLAGLLVATARPAEAAWTTSLYPDGVVPDVIAADDNQSVELGTKFKVSTPGTILAVRFYKSAANGGTHTGSLWDSQGNELATVTFDNERRQGWVNAYFDTPVKVVPNRNYVVSYHTDQGAYSYSEEIFNGAATIGNPYLTASVGLYDYGDHALPGSVWHDSAYYVDVVFRPTDRLSDGTTTPAPSDTSSASPTTSSAPTTTAPAPTTSDTPTPAPTTTSSSPSKAPSSAPSTSGNSGNGKGNGNGGSGNSFPGLLTTGVSAGVKLLQVPGQLTSGVGWRWNGTSVKVTSSDATLADLDISGGLVGASGLTLRDTKIRCTGVTDWCLSLGSGSTVVDTEIGGGSDGTSFTPAIGVWTGGPNNVLDSVEIHHVSDGLRVDGGTTVQNSYIHALVMSEIPGTHSDGSQSTAGSAPVVFKHNTIEGGTNDAIFDQASGPFTVTGNYIIAVNRGGQQSSYGVGGGGSAVDGPVVITNNTFSRGWQAQPVQTNAWPSGTTISGNKYTDGSSI